jgi:hypothetical protein
MGGKSSKPLREQVGSFFHGMTGWMTAAAGLIVAVAGALTALGVIPFGPAQPSVSAAAWAAQANKICGQFNDEVDRLPPPTSFQSATGAPSSSGLRDAALWTTAADKISRQMLRQLKALKIPTGKEQQVTKFVRLLAAVNNHADTVTADLNILASEPQSARTPRDVLRMYNAIQELSRLNNEFDKAAINLGATTCAEGGGPNILGRGG